MNDVTHNGLHPGDYEPDEFAGELDDLIRAKGQIDGATTLAEAAEKAREFAAELQRLHDEGHVLHCPVYDDYAWYYKP
jgi:hypothetical protein